LGWDWKVTAAVLASFPAREVVIAVLGTLYAVEASDEQGETSLIKRIRAATHEDGSLVFTLPMALGLMVFYALCLQCSSTIAVIRRETGSWRWPAIAWGYMTALGYIGALICFQFGTALSS
jgi:ferrous iron transport protein B